MSWEKFKQALFDRGPDTGPLASPRRDDDVARWLRWQRDSIGDDGPGWRAIDGLLATYELHADTGTPLNEHACDYFCDCEGRERVRW